MHSDCLCHRASLCLEFSSGVKLLSMSEDTLTITDNRTGKQYQLPIEDGTIRAMDLRQIKVSDDDFGLDDLRPGVHEHRLVQESHHVHRRRQGNS